MPRVVARLKPLVFNLISFWINSWRKYRLKDPGISLIEQSTRESPHDLR